MLENVGEEGLRVLQYVHLVDRHGAHLTLAQLDQFADTARPKWVPDFWEGSGDVDFVRTIRWSEYLHALEWIDVAGPDIESAQEDEIRDRAPVRLTGLGRSVLQACEGSEPTLAAQVLLGDEDPLAYGQVIAHLAGLGSGLLIDAYLTERVLGDLLTVTTVNRILTSTKGRRGRERVKTLAALGFANGLRPVSIRANDRLHDRFFIADGGEVVALGSSLNGVSKNITTLARLSGDAAHVLRVHFEDVWQDSIPLPAELPLETAQQTEEPALGQ
jgi:hypothetical protein